MKNVNEKELIDLMFDKWLYENYFAYYIELHEKMEDYKSINSVPDERRAIGNHAGEKRFALG